MPAAWTVRLQTNSQSMRAHDRLDSSLPTHLRRPNAGSLSPCAASREGIQQGTPLGMGVHVVTSAMSRETGKRSVPRGADKGVNTDKHPVVPRGCAAQTPKKRYGPLTKTRLPSRVLPSPRPASPASGLLADLSTRDPAGLRHDSANYPSALASSPLVVIPLHGTIATGPRSFPQSGIPAAT
jgi:hypothetical protein